MAMRDCWSTNLGGLGLLPEAWDQKIKEVARKSGVFVHLDGKDSSSREPDDSEGSDYYVVDGERIFFEIRWLYDIYAGALREIAERVSGKKLIISPDRKSAININIIRGIGERYEWHVDMNPITGLIFVDSLKNEDGGELRFRIAGEEDAVIWPRAGEFLVFDARDKPHCVMPLKRDIERISIPMNFFHEEMEEGELEEANVSKYIFGER